MKRMRVMGVVIAAAAAWIGVAGPAAAQWPEKPIRLIVPYAPGGGADIAARAFGNRLGEALGKAVVVDNRPGGAGNIGVEMAARAAPDGYTLLLAPAGITVNVSLFPKFPIDPVRDFEPISLLVHVPLVVVVHPSVPVKSIAELIELAKAKPGLVNYGSGGSGTANHTSAELFKLLTGVNMPHIPYKGGGPALNDLVAGHIQVAFTSMGATMGFVNGGRLRALAVTTLKRSPSAPNIPTVVESGVPGYEASAWYGMLAPAGTPRPIVERLSAELGRIARSQAMRDQFAAEGIEPVGSTPAELGEYMRRETAKWAKVVKASGMKAE